MATRLRRYGRAFATGLTLVTAGVSLAAVVWIFRLGAPELDRATRHSLAMCEDWPEGEAVDGALEGELSAIDCMIASERVTVRSLPELESAEDWLRLGYMRWRVSGESSPIALEAAAQMTRDDVLLQTAGHEAGMRFTPEPEIGPDGCWIVNSVQVELMRVAQPDARTEPCMDSYLAQAGLDDGSDG